MNNRVYIKTRADLKMQIYIRDPSKQMLMYTTINRFVEINTIAGRYRKQERFHLESPHQSIYFNRRNLKITFYYSGYELGHYKQKNNKNWPVQYCIKKNSITQMKDLYRYEKSFCNSCSTMHSFKRKNKKVNTWHMT